MWKMSLVFWSIGSHEKLLLRLTELSKRKFPQWVIRGKNWKVTSNVITVHIFVSNRLFRIVSVILITNLSKRAVKQDCMDDAWYSFFNLPSFDCDLKNMRSCIHFRKKMKTLSKKWINQNFCTFERCLSKIRKECVSRKGKDHLTCYCSNELIRPCLLFIWLWLKVPFIIGKAVKSRVFQFTEHIGLWTGSRRLREYQNIVPSKYLSAIPRSLPKKRTEDDNNLADPRNDTPCATCFGRAFS